MIDGKILIDGKPLSPRYVLIHTRQAVTGPESLDRAAHAFGPFDTYDDLVAFDGQWMEDDCYRFAVPVIGPERRDMTIAAIAMSLGARPAALTLPDRAPKPAIEGLVKEALRHAKKEAKRAKKEAKRSEGNSETR